MVSPIHNVSGMSSRVGRSKPPFRPGRQIRLPAELSCASRGFARILHTRSHVMCYRRIGNMVSATSLLSQDSERVQGRARVDRKARQGKSTRRRCIVAPQSTQQIVLRLGAPEAVSETSRQPMRSAHGLSLRLTYRSSAIYASCRNARAPRQCQPRFKS